MNRAIATEIGWSSRRLIITFLIIQLLINRVPEQPVYRQTARRGTCGKEDCTVEV